jgi:hypothetical protein
MKLTGAAILVLRGMKVLQAAPAAYPYRSASKARTRGRVKAMAVFRPRLLAFWFLLSASVLALPVAILATCEVRGEYVPKPEEKFTIGPTMMHGLRSLWIGAAIGALLTVGLGIAAGAVRRMIRRAATNGKPTQGTDGS